MRFEWERSGRVYYLCVFSLEWPSYIWGYVRSQIEFGLMSAYGWMFRRPVPLVREVWCPQVFWSETIEARDVRLAWWRENCPEAVEPIWRWGWELGRRKKADR